MTSMEYGQKQTIVLTGATGFVGSAVLKQIIKDGNIPIVLKRPVSNMDRIKDIKGYRSFTYESLQNQNLINEIKAYKPKALIHLAWHGVSGQARNESYQIIDNLPLTLDTVKFAHEVGCNQWIGIGSQAEYGNPNCKVDEDYPTNPTTVYGRAKLACCWAGLGLCHAYDMVGSWIRLFSLYGPDDNPNWLIPYLIREILEGRIPKLTKCEQLWDYLYIDDVARGILSVTYKQTPGIFNLGSGVAVPIKKVVETIRELANPGIQPDYGALPYRPDQVMHLEADISKIKSITGWRPEVGLQQGLENTMRAFK